MGDLEFAQTLLSDFEGDLPNRVDQILRSVGQRDAVNVAEAAHALKGAAGILAAEPVRVLAAKIEANGKAGNLEAIASLTDALCGAAQRCLGFIPEIRKTVLSP
jgi:Amt family ammonium transporter